MRARKVHVWEGGGVRETVAGFVAGKISLRFGIVRKCEDKGNNLYATRGQTRQPPYQWLQFSSHAILQQ
jgi:hypothetical protein